MHKNLVPIMGQDKARGKRTGLITVGISTKEFLASLERGANLLKGANTVTRHHIVSMHVKSYKKEKMVVKVVSPTILKGVTLVIHQNKNY